MHHIPFRLRLRPMPLGSLQNFPRDLALFKMSTSNRQRGQRRGQRQERDEKGREGKGRGGDHTASNSKPLSALFVY